MAEDETAPPDAPPAVWCADPAAAAPLTEAMGLTPLAALPEAAGGPLLLLHFAPVQAMARALAAGTAPEAALADWRAGADALLRLGRSDRRHVRLADLNAALARPGALWTALDLPGRAPDPAPSDPADPILSLMAERLLLGAAADRARIAELQAARLDLGADPFAPEAALATWRRRRAEAEVLRAETEALQGELAGTAAARTAAERERAALDIALQAARAEAAETARAGAAQIDLLRAQIGAMQTELETIARARQQMEARAEQMGQGLESHQARIDDLEAQAARRQTRLAEKNGALQAAARQLAELRAATDARERDRLAEIARAEAERAETAAALAAARAELARVTASRSYRITAPLRRLRGLLGGSRS